MKKATNKAKVLHYVSVVCGIVAILVCIATVVLSVNDSYLSIYFLSASIMLLGINHLCSHLHPEKKRLIETLSLTVFLFVLSVLVGFTKINIYFLIASLFGYSLTIILYCLAKMKNEKSVQMKVFYSLCIAFSFLFSFVFFFPAIYEKHASTVSNYNFIALCFAVMILVSSSKNIVFSYRRVRGAEMVSDVIKKSLVKEIVLGLFILVILCSVYFTLAEPNIASYIDALWYSFAVITTIGFGDVYVVTTLGRILSVILGISGIAVVAVFTSLIVNFYNEMSRKRDEKTLKKLIKEVEELEAKQEKAQKDKKEEEGE